jgi:hypothetical protein
MTDPDHNNGQHIHSPRDARAGVTDVSLETTGASTPEEVSALAKHQDPSRPTRETGIVGPGGRNGITWVRPSELMVTGTSRIAGRGIDFQAALTLQSRRLTRQSIATSRHAINERAHRLPPLSAFGRTTRQSADVGRSGIGLT